MLNVGTRDGPSPKCYFTSSVLPAFLDDDQIPSKKKPFSNILNQKFNHTLDVILPRASAESLKQKLTGDAGKLQYAKVYMKLGDIIEGDFFNSYMKSGNILMLAEGRRGIDHNFSLSDGILRLEVNKATFERMGLEGKAMPSEGRQHVKARYAIELNLRLPSMVRGHKGFERVIWAFKNVLNQSLTWLFLDLQGPNDGSGPISAYQPNIKTVQPDFVIMEAIRVPDLPQTIEEDEYGDATEILEWLSLVVLGSPRVQDDDRIDPYLSRYRVLCNEKEATDSNMQDLVRLTWHGFIPATFIKQMLLATLKACGEEWFAFRSVAFDGKSYVFLHQNHHTLTWEYLD